jgi:hypothetical protein
MPKGQRFLDRVAQTGELNVTVLASSKYPTFMTIDTLSNVQEFHELFACEIGATSEVPSGPHDLQLTQVRNHLMELRAYMREFSKADVRCLRVALILEETAELVEALAERNTLKALDALGDMDYIDKGTAITLGLQDVYYEACQRIHDSNLSKLVDGLPVKDSSGKVTKGPNYKPVDLTDLVDGSWLAEQEELAKL